MTTLPEDRRLLNEASEALLVLTHAVHRREAGIKHQPIDELAAKANAAHHLMMDALMQTELAERGDLRVDWRQR